MAFSRREKGRDVRIGDPERLHPLTQDAVD